MPAHVSHAMALRVCGLGPFAGGPSTINARLSLWLAVVACDAVAMLVAPSAQVSGRRAVLVFGFGVRSAAPSHGSSTSVFPALRLGLQS